MKHHKFIKFSSEFFLFSIPVILVIILFEFFLRNIPNDYSHKRKYLDKNIQNIEVLLLGSSYVYFGVNPLFFSKNTFNVANVSQTIYIDCQIFKKYYSRFKKIKYIVIPVSQGSMNQSLGDGMEAWRVLYYNAYFGLNFDTKFANNYEILTKKTNYNINRFYNYYYGGKSNLSCNNLGWGHDYQSKYNADLIKTGIAQSNSFSTFNMSNFAKNNKALNEVINLCNKKNIKVMLINFPAYHSYTDRLDKYTLGKSEKYFIDLSHKKNVFYYNMLKDKSFFEVDFWDATHLNEIGTKKMSIKLDSIINSLDHK